MQKPTFRSSKWVKQDSLGPQHVASASPTKDLVVLENNEKFPSGFLEALGLSTGSGRWHFFLTFEASEWFQGNPRVVSGSGLPQHCLSLSLLLFWPRIGDCNTAPANPRRGADRRRGTRGIQPHLGGKPLWDRPRVSAAPGPPEPKRNRTPTPASGLPPPPALFC